jgi:hypothetical protein
MTGPTVPWSKTRCLTLRPQLENAPAAALLAGLGVVGWGVCGGPPWFMSIAEAFGSKVFSV